MVDESEILATVIDAQIAHATEERRAHLLAAASAKRLIETLRATRARVSLVEPQTVVDSQGESANA